MTAKKKSTKKGRTPRELGPKGDTIVAKNIRAAIAHSPKSAAELGELMGIDQTTLGRIGNGVHSPKVSTLEKFAQVTGYAAWQLLHPDFHPELVPPMGDPQAMRVAAVFAAISDPKRREIARAVMEQFAEDVPLTSPTEEPVQGR